MNSGIEITGIFENGYGQIPKKLICFKFGNIKLKRKARSGENKEIKIKGINIKIILCYMFSFLGGGKKTCFPTIQRISEDLEISKELIVNTIHFLVDIGVVKKEKLYPDNKLNHNNKYIINMDVLNNFIDKN
ncbi:MAG: hypothetical protein GY679_01520 [Mycoplasma sp.]|nr:hypothetical protein [Mycoplasma sp.]